MVQMQCKRGIMVQVNVNMVSKNMAGVLWCMQRDIRMGGISGA